MKSVLVDTGAWYAYIDKDDPDHHSVSEILENHFPFLLTTDFIVDETLTLLRYRHGRTSSVKFGELVFSGNLASLEYVKKSDQKKAWKLFLKYHDHCFSFTDCISFVLMERLKIQTAVAIDSDFRSYGLHCLPTV